MEVESEDAEEVEVDTIVEGEVEGDDHDESEEEENEEEEEEEDYKIDDAAWATFKSKFNKVYTVSKHNYKTYNSFRSSYDTLEAV